MPDIDRLIIMLGILDKLTHEELDQVEMRITIRRCILNRKDDAELQMKNAECS